MLEDLSPDAPSRPLDRTGWNGGEPAGLSASSCFDSSGTNSKVRVVQTVFGRFHHFDLARQLQRRGCLEAIFTAYPRWKLREESLPRDRVRTFPWLLAPLMAKWRFGWRHKWLDRELSWLMAETLDRYVARRVPVCDVFVGISGSGLHTMRHLRKGGVRCICDRASSHIRYGDRLLREEFSRWGESFPGVDPRSIKKEEREYALADVITLPSEFARRSFEREGVNSAKLRVLPYGVDLGRFSSDNRAARDGFAVLFVGQVSLRKGVPYLLEAFARLRHPKKRLVLAGAVAPEMNSLLRKRAWTEVELPGPQPRSEVRRLMSEAHVFVLPSVEDGFGLVMAEAMACGCPVIGTEHTGAPDLIEHGREGFVVPIRDSTTLASRLEQLCQDRDLRDRMAAAALARVRSLGGWNDYGDSFMRVLRELMP